MFRLIKFFLFLGFIVTIVAGAFVWVARVPIVERLLTKKLGTKVTIEAIKIGWSEITLHNLHLFNPTPSTSPYAFTAESITILVHPLELISHTSYIDQIKITNPYFTLELYNSSGADNNWMRILNRFPSSRGSRHSIIDKLMVTNLTFKASRSNGKSINVAPLTYLELDHLGKVHPLTVSQVSKVLFEVILHSLTSKQHLGSILDNVQALPQNLIHGMHSTIPLEEEKGLLKEGFDKIKRTTQAATSFILDFFTSKSSV